MKYLLLTVLLFLTPYVFADDGRKLIRQGNRLFEEGSYTEAEGKYRDAIENDGESFVALYNLANSLYKQGRLEEAGEIFNTLRHMAPGDEELTSVLHNIGNSYLGRGMIQESIDAYKEALRISPGEEDTRYNLAYAQNLLEEHPPQDEPDSSDGENGEDEDQLDSPDTGGDQQSPPQDDQLTQEDAERILEALRQQEQEIQQNIIRGEEDTGRVITGREW